MSVGVVWYARVFTVFEEMLDYSFWMVWICLNSLSAILRRIIENDRISEVERRNQGTTGAGTPIASRWFAPRRMVGAVGAFGANTVGCLLLGCSLKFLQAARTSLPEIEKKKFLVLGAQFGVWTVEQFCPAMSGIGPSKRVYWKVPYPACHWLIRCSSAVANPCPCH